MGYKSGEYVFSDQFFRAQDPQSMDRAGMGSYRMAIRRTGSYGTVVNSQNPLKSVVATITDASGNVVNSVDLGNINAGMSNFIWNGQNADGSTVPAGMYYLNLSGTNAADASENPTAYVASAVASVTKGANGDAILNLLDGRTIASSEVQQWIS